MAAASAHKRKGGNSDIASLQRELDSLRGYRDVLHDTMKGLVAQSQGKLTPKDQPELATALAQVAELLAAFAAAVSSAAQDSSASSSPTINEEVDALRAEICLLYTSPSPRDATLSRMPSSA